MSLLNDDFEKLQTLNEVLTYRAHHQGNKIVFRFIADNNKITSLTYRQLHTSALHIAKQLLTLAKPGDRALLSYTDTIEFIKALFGCFYAGIIAVPGHPPSHINKVERMGTIIDESSPHLLLTSSNSLAAIEAKLSDDKVNQITLVVTDSREFTDSDAASNFLFSNDVALMQFTSGTVTTAKGVVVTHKNIMANASYIKHAMGYTINSHGVSWLPIYHDMGLIGSVIQPVYSGASITLFSSMRFIRDPLFWLRTLSEEKATASGAPDFAYRLCANRVNPDQLEKLDLSHWEIANIGADLIKAETLKLFTEKFSSCGFAKDAFYPSYGMAETTLFISGKKCKEPTTFLNIDKIKLRSHQVSLVGETHPDKKTLVGCGWVWQDSSLKIVHPTSQQQLSDNVVGEIWIKANNVAQSYWNKPLLTNISLQAFIDKSDSGPFFRTGDLGFVYNNELFVTGRISDLISHNNLRFYANDIESVASASHPAIHALPSIVFQLQTKNQHHLILVQEIDYRKITTDVFTEITEVIYQTVLQEYNLKLHEIILIKPHQCPKTSSGKLMRSRCKTNYVKQSIEAVFHWKLQEGSYIKEKSNG